jgi:long-subunit acyl-CoA synthetase (AMP-forming)
MLGYVKNETATKAAIHQDGWYTEFGDICFWLTHANDGGRDMYWQSRDSNLLIRGGANYAYEQVQSELKVYIATHTAFYFCRLLTALA